AGGVEAPRLHLLRDLRVLRVDDVRLTRGYRVDLSLVEVDARHLEARARELERQRQADVTEADHAAARLALADLVDEVLHGIRLLSLLDVAEVFEPLLDFRL